MAIISITEYKALPAYNSGQADALIEALIPEVEAHFKELQGAPFLQFLGSMADGAAVITNILAADRDPDYISNLVANNSSDYDLIVDSLERNQVVQCGTYQGKVVRWTGYDDRTITVDTAADEAISSGFFIVYPAGAKLIASRMIKYLIENDGEKAYSIGDESIQYDEFLGIYPKSIVGGIRRYVGAL